MVFDRLGVNWVFTTNQWVEWMRRAIWKNCLSLSLAMLCGELMARRTDCRRAYPNDLYAQKVCECENAFEQKISGCLTEACIGAAALARTKCIAQCSKYMDRATGFWDPNDPSAPIPVMNLPID